MKVTVLNSVGCVLVGNITYPQTICGGYDEENPFPIDEIENDEWWSNLSDEDVEKLKELNVKFPWN